MVVPMKAMRYSKSITEKHPLAEKYLEKIGVLLKNEGMTKNPFTDENAIDLEACENDKKLSQPQPRMDFAIGLESNNMLLVEAKLNVTKSVNLSDGELKKKVQYSKSLLNDKYWEIPVAQEKVFLFHERYIQRAKHEIKQRLGSNPQIRIYTVQEFKEKTFQ